jgi:hypothetical protein
MVQKIGLYNMQRCLNNGYPRLKGSGWELKLHKPCMALKQGEGNMLILENK